MLFRRARPKKATFDDYLNHARAAGFEVAQADGGRFRVTRRGAAAIVENGGDKPKLHGRAGLLIDGEIATLVDGGFQKFLQTPSGVRKPALASELHAVHEFEEDLREALGLTSLYNESLGSVSTLYLYDRVKDRDSSQPKKPWEQKVR